MPPLMRPGKRPASAAASCRVLCAAEVAAEAAETAGATARALGPTGIGSIDALLALQAVGGSLERRRRALRRADKILDVLDEVKISLLEGEVPANALSNLVKAVQQTRDSTDDPGLESVLNEIETRAAVEIAKLETR